MKGFDSSNQKVATTYTESSRIEGKSNCIDEYELEPKQGSSPSVVSVISVIKKSHSTSIRTYYDS